MLICSACCAVCTSFCSVMQTQTTCSYIGRKKIVMLVCNIRDLGMLMADEDMQAQTIHGSCAVTGPENRTEVC